MSTNLFHAYMDTPVGVLRITTDDCCVCAISFVEESGKGSEVGSPVLSDAIMQLKEYFAGQRTQFTLRLNPQGTIFQREIWKIVSQIEFGDTKSYLDIARTSGDKARTRAVGLANGKNPIPILIPCHRVIGANGSLTGYAGGLERKKWLLQHEIKYGVARGTLF